MHHPRDRLIQPLPRPTILPLLEHTANTHLLTPLLHHECLNLLLHRQHHTVTPHNLHLFRFPGLQLLVPRFDLFLRGALVRANMVMCVEKGCEVLHHDGVVHKDLFVPGELGGVEGGWQGANEGC